MEYWSKPQSSIPFLFKSIKSTLPVFTKTGNINPKPVLDLGIKELPVAWIPAGTSETVCRAYAIADNRTAEHATWNTEQLDKVIAELQDIDIQDIDIEDIGFNEAELEALLANTDFDFDKAMGKEYDEIIANEVEMIECPNCGHQFAK